MPLLRFDATDPAWLTLDEAIAAGTLEVTEVTEGGSVSILRVVNKGERAVFLLDGEELAGAKQNRILNTSVLIAAGQTITMPVSCVEQGRWAYRSRAFTSAKRSLYASVRRKKAAQVHESLRMKRGHTADQGRIWADLEAQAEAHGIQSPTCAMSDVFESRGVDLEAYARALPPEPGQVGGRSSTSGANGGRSSSWPARTYSRRRGSACCRATRSRPPTRRPASADRSLLRSG